MFLSNFWECKIFLTWYLTAILFFFFNFLFTVSWSWALLIEFLLCLSQVDLQFPKVVSDGARDLISKLLRHSPSMRLPLKSVIEHPWVKANSRRVLPPVYNPQAVPNHWWDLLKDLFETFRNLLVWVHRWFVLCCHKNVCVCDINWLRSLTVNEPDVWCKQTLRLFYCSFTLSCIAVVLCSVLIHVVLLSSIN